MHELSVHINGRSHRLGAGATIADLLRSVDIDVEQTGIAVAVNDRVVRKGEWQNRRLEDDDRVDVIQATQGG
jgi:sulfur carrier protein